MVLDPTFVEKCRKGFVALQASENAIQTMEIKVLLKTILNNDPDDELPLRLMSEIDEDYIGQVDFAELVRAIDSKNNPAKEWSIGDIASAWTSLGGNRDTSGDIDAINNATSPL